MNKLGKLIHTLEKDELENLKRDLLIGNMEKLINKRLLMLSTGEMKICPVCGNDINILKDEYYKLEFGDQSLRRQAYFDALDCMQFFIDKSRGQEVNQ